MPEGRRGVLLVSDVGVDDPGGRASNFATRAELLAEDRWDVTLGVVPEPYVRTFLPRIWRCYRLGKHNEVDVVNSVSNPFHLHLVGLVVSTLLGVPWVAEFRDPMVDNPDRDPWHPLTKLASIVEWLVVHGADRVVWGDGIQMADDYFERTYDVDPERIRKLPFQGFLPEEFEGASTNEYDVFTMTYAGSFYEGWIEPYAFLDGVERYVSERGSGDLRVQFYGDWEEAYDEKVAAAGLEDVVEHHEFVPKAELVPVLKASDVLVYVGGDDPRNRLNVPSKVYDYVGAKRPILAVVDPSFRVAELIMEYDLGVTAAPDDPCAIADAIERLRMASYRPDDDVVDLFNRERKLEALVDVFEQVT